MHIQKTVDNRRKPFDFRLRDWYQCAESVSIDKGFCLSSAYYDYWYPHKYIITYSYPVYNDGKFLGVGLHDIFLESINENVFLISMINVDRDGNIIYEINYWYMVFLFLLTFILLLIVTKVCYVAIPMSVSYFDVDELTKLNTRKSFKYLQANEKIKAVCLIDIDFFKKINDNFGHDIGDLYLFEVSNKLLSSIRKSDKLYRWGGEEFLLLLTNASGEEYDHRLTLERLRKNIESIAIKDINHKVTATIGFSDYSTEFDIDDMIKKADRALYVGKQSGRNQVVKYEDIV